MNLFGTLRELAQIVMRKDTRNITIKPSTAVTYTADRISELPPEDAASVLVSETASQVLTNKTLTAPVINGGSVNGASAVSLVDNGANDLSIVTASALTADRNLTIDVNDANRSLDLSGNLVLANNLTTTGNFPVSLAATASTSLTLPVSGTLATLADVATASQQTTDLISVGFSTVAGTTYNHHHFTLDVGQTITVVAGSTFVGIGPMEINGTLEINGEYDIV